MPGQWWELSIVRRVAPPRKLVRRKFWLLLSVVLCERNNVSMRLSTRTLTSVDILSTKVWQTRLTMPDSNKCIMSDGVASVMPNGLWPNLISKNALSQRWADMASRAAMYSFISFSRALLWWRDSGSSSALVSGGTDSCVTFSFNALWYAIRIHRHLCSGLSRSALPHKHILGTLAMQFLPPKRETSVSPLLASPFTKVMTGITVIRRTTSPIRTKALKPPFFWAVTIPSRTASIILW